MIFFHSNLSCQLIFCFAHTINALRYLKISTNFLIWKQEKCFQFFFKLWDAWIVFCRLSVFLWRWPFLAFVCSWFRVFYLPPMYSKQNSKSSDPFITPYWVQYLLLSLIITWRILVKIIKIKNLDYESHLEIKIQNSDLLIWVLEY